jgi:hypothetical protein
MAEARKFFARALGIFSSNLGGDNLYSTTIEEHLNSLPQTQLLQENVDDDYDDGFYF